MVESFLKELLTEGFPALCCSVKLAEDPVRNLAADSNITDKVAEAGKELTMPEAHQGYGMKFLLTQAKDLGIEKTFLEEIFKTLAKFHYS